MTTQASKFIGYRSQVLHTHLASADAREELPGFERLRGRGSVEGLIDGRQPETLLVGEVVTRTLGPVTFDEGSGAEIFKTRARRDQRLTATLVSSCRVHEEGIANPQTSPPCWALWDSYVLTVYGNGHRWGFTHGTAADVGFNLRLLHGHHRNWCSSGQPIGFVISASVVAYVTRIAVQERHGVETRET